MGTELQRALLDWSAAAGRDLPWRRTRDPWAVMVSEVMLQQTQVARVVAAWCGWRVGTAGTAGTATAATAVTDPAAGSARTGGTQSTFAGSDRQGRGRLVDALRRGPVAWVGAAAAAGWPDDHERARRVAASLVADGLAADDGSILRLG